MLACDTNKLGSFKWDLIAFWQQRVVYRLGGYELWWMWYRLLLCLNLNFGLLEYLRIWISLLLVLEAHAISIVVLLFCSLFALTLVIMVLMPNFLAFLIEECFGEIVHVYNI